jgi:MFS family permease
VIVPGLRGLAAGTSPHASDSASAGSAARLGGLTAYWLGLSILWGSLTTVVLPRLVEQVVPAAVKTSALALVAGVQAVVSIVVQPAAGAASDHWSSRWGRRRPLMVVGVAAQLLFLALLVRAEALWAIVVVMALEEAASNSAQGPYQGLLPDVVPADRHGLASGLLGGAQLAGQVLGVAVSGMLVTMGDDAAAIAFAGGAVALGLLTTVATAAERTSPGPGSGLAADLRAGVARSLGHLRHGLAWRRAIRTVVLDVWGPDVLERRDYIWLLVSRLAILMATGTLQPFIYFYVEDAIGLGPSAASGVVPLAALVALVALVTAVPGGAATARWGRVRTVLASALLGAAGAAAFAVAPSYAALFPIAIPFGMAMGLFLSADWALLVDLVPPDEAGRYLGLSNVATAGAGLLAVAIGGPIADLVNAASPGLGYRAVFVLAAIEFLAGAWFVRHVHEPATAATQA